MILGLVDAYADLYQLEENSDVFLSPKPPVNIILSQ